MTNYFRRNRKSSVLSHILTPKETNLTPPMPTCPTQIANNKTSEADPKPAPLCLHMVIRLQLNLQNIRIATTSE